MKTLLFGNTGQVGHELNRSLLPLGELVALGRGQADFSQPQSLAGIVRAHKPDVIVNAVAYTAVDKAEEDEALAHAVNAEAPAVLAGAAREAGALLVHYSTDYVFDGRGDAPFSETDATAPLNVYGRSKLAGEQAIAQVDGDYLIFRTSWVYAARGHNFLKTILRLAAERESLNIVADQIGAPTPARLIADVTALCLHQAMRERCLGVFSPGLYHLVAGGETSWHGFAEAIIELARQQGAALKLNTLSPIPTCDYPTPAQRPLNSRLDTTRLESQFGLSLPDWRAALQRVMTELPLPH